MSVFFMDSRTPCTIFDACKWYSACRLGNNNLTSILMKNAFVVLAQTVFCYRVW
jgi:hypothetical protein